MIHLRPARRRHTLLATLAGAAALTTVPATNAAADATYCGRPHVVGGAIQAKYDGIGGPRSPLGCPISGERTTPNGRGKFTTFDGGSIYWTANTGAHPVWGVIGDKWGQLGWETGALGFPTSDELTTPDGQGKRQVYEGGTLYWHPTRSNGAHPVWGKIGEKWAQAGWERGVYGWPITDEIKGGRAEDGAVQQFEKGPVAWAPGERENGQWARARAKFLDRTDVPGGDLAQSATLLPPGPDRGIVVARGFIADTSVFNGEIGEHRGFSTDATAAAKGTVAWDTATGRVGLYVHLSCASVACWAAKPLRRTPDAKLKTDTNDIQENLYWVEPYGDGGIRVDVSLINGFGASYFPEFSNFGRINATFWITPRRYVPGQLINDTSTFDVRTTKDRFPSWEVLRFPRVLPTASARTAQWIGRVGQTTIGDLKGAQHSCSRIGVESDDPSMTCS